VAGLASRARPLLRLPLMFATFVFMLASMFVAPQAALDQPTTAPPPESIMYRFENELFTEPRFELIIDATGSGKLVFSRKGITRPIERPVSVRGEVMAELNAILDRLDFLRSTETYQTKDDHANLGTMTVAVSRGGLSREVQFNYTNNRDMEALVQLLRGLTTRERHAFDLETATQYSRLEIPTHLQTLKNDIALKRVTDPIALVPLLRQIADDPSLPLIAQNRARQLADEIENRKRD
jgi:hypothetical protein